MTSPPPADLGFFIQILDFLTEAINSLTAVIQTPEGALVIGVALFLIDAALAAANITMEAICG